MFNNIRVEGSTIWKELKGGNSTVDYGIGRGLWIDCVCKLFLNLKMGYMIKWFLNGSVWNLEIRQRGN